MRVTQVFDDLALKRDPPRRITAESVDYPFELDGTQYHIDLSEASLKRLRADMEPFVTHARRVGLASSRPRTTKKGGGTAAATRPVEVNAVEREQIRAWCKKNGIHVADRGRLPAAAVEAWRAASGEDTPIVMPDRQPGFTG